MSAELTLEVHLKKAFAKILSFVSFISEFNFSIQTLTADCYKKLFIEKKKKKSMFGNLSQARRILSFQS